MRYRLVDSELPRGETFPRRIMCPQNRVVGIGYPGCSLAVSPSRSRITSIITFFSVCVLVQCVQLCCSFRRSDTRSVRW